MATTINFGRGTNTTAMPASKGSKKSSIDNDTWKKVAIGGVSAIVFGGAAYAATSMMSGSEAAEEFEANDGTDTGVAESGASASASVPAADFNPTMQMATSVNDDMSFSEAFAAARAEVHAGGMFEWHGQVYGTYYGDEWDSLSPDQQSAFTAGTSEVASEHRAEAPSEVEVATVTEEEIGGMSPLTPEEEAETGTEEVAEVKIDRIDYDPENEVSTAYVTVDDTEVIMADIDNDGVFDVMFIDENNDGLVAENEVYDISDENITVQGLGGYSEPTLDEYIGNDDFMANNEIDIDSIEL
ncbi:MAG: hypothetical protein NC102_06990 [Clostridium sp.]|nr:hypothetical protein [Clostridium sp.]